MKKNFFSNTSKYIFILILLFLVSFGTSCRSIVNNISSNISFNYPGLRLETIAIDDDTIEESHPVVVCFGDSVTFGWNLKYEESYPYLLEKDISKEYDDVLVVNSGIGGNTIIDGLNRVEKDVLDFEPDIVFSSFGLNDGMLFQIGIFKDDANIKFLENGETFYTRLSLNAFRSHYLDLINIFEGRDIPIVLMTTNPVLMSFQGNRSEDFRKMQNEIYGIFNEEIRAIAEEYDLPLIDIEEAFREKQNIHDYIQDDGIHPESSGLELIATTISESGIINKLLEK